MKKISLSKRIENYLRHNVGWTHSGEIEKLAIGAGYKGSTASRICRVMASGRKPNGQMIEPVLERKDHGGSVWYRYKGRQKEITAVTFNEETNSVIISKQMKLI